MVASEREMVKKYADPAAQQPERFTSLQPTYEDSVPDDEQIECNDDSISESTRT